ncbi:MAG: DNA polymerase IV [Spirochaetia bacterium]|nr:DNA polymerase IV [Spirochaetia bacterium]MBR0319330.1 DNA polymerase IV [Spirochaetia bacterium]
MMQNVFFCADMDAFFASVEQHDNPDYKGKPLIVGGMEGHRGVVSACSYEARKFGVHSAMPSSTAHKLCPNGIFVPVRMARYKEVSDHIMEIFSRFAPEVIQNSIDEAFLDLTGTDRLMGPPVEVASKIKACVKEETGLTVSIGIGENRYLAKLASDYRKPDGLYQVEKGKEIEFIDSIPLKKLWGIGKSTYSRLEKSGITSAAQIRSFSSTILEGIFGKGASDFLSAIAWGKDPGICSMEHKSRSISNEITFDQDVGDYAVLRETLLGLSHQITFRLLKKGWSSKTLALKIRLDNFSTSTIQVTQDNAFTSAEEVFQASLALLQKKWDRKRNIRLIGLGFQNADETGKTQLQLFDDIHEKQNKVEKAVLNLNSRFQNNQVIKAALLKKP